MRTWWMLTAVLAVSISAFADKPAGLGPVAGVVNQDTVMIVHVQVNDKTFAAVRDRFKTICEGADKLTPLPAGKKSPVEEMTQWYNDFIKAGGTEIYIVSPDGSGDLIVLPLSPKADVKALRKVMNVQDDAEPAEPTDPREKMMHEYQQIGKKVGDNLILGRRGQVDKLKDFTAADRQDLAKAMAAAGDAPFRLAMALPEKLRKKMPATLPSEMGGGATESVSKSFQWLSASAKIDPAVAIDAVVQATDEKSAAAMLETYTRAMDGVKVWMKDNQDRGPGIMGVLALKVLDLAAAKVKGSQIVAHLDADQIEKVLKDIPAAMAESREMAVRSVALSQVSNLVWQAIMSSHSNEDGQLPPDIQTIAKNSPNLLTNQRFPDRKPGFIYIRSTVKMSELANPSQVILIYENFKEWDKKGIAVGFADGHVQLMKSEEKFKKLLADQAKAPEK